MKVEIDMINVEDGDAIFIGLTKETGDKALIVIDGGYGKFYDENDFRVRKRLNEILPQYGGKIRLLICTHYDNDHLVGAGKILEDHHENIEEIWIHKIEDTLLDELSKMESRLAELYTENESKKKFQKLAGFSSFQGPKIIENYKQLKSFLGKIRIYGLEDKIKEVFRGHQLKDWEDFSVISPTHEYYTAHLESLKQERYVEDIKFNLNEQNGIYRYKDFVNETRKMIDATNPCSKLETSSIANGVTATNMVSIVCLLNVNDKKFLFTGDAGIETFEKQNILDHTLSELYWLDIPHHGSKNNTSKNMLEHFNPEIAFCSGNGGANRPHYNIVNCLSKNRTGKNLFVTNDPENTWYITINENGDIKRVELP